MSPRKSATRELREKEHARIKKVESMIKPKTDNYPQIYTGG